MKSILALGVVLTTALLSCGKWRTNHENTAISNSKVEAAFDEMTNISDQAITGNLVFYKNGNVIYSKPGQKPVLEKTTCNVVITIDTVSIPHSVTVDWGATNCDCNDGKTRRGKIITTFTGPYLAQGTILTHTPVDYYVNDIHIEGTKTVENMGLNAANQPYFNVSINGVATFTSGEVLTYVSSRVRTWTSGFNTPFYRFDDEYDISGSASGSYASGTTYIAQITSPVHIKIGCGFPVSGSVELTPSGLPTRYIDYGSGTCDYTFTVTVNGHVYTFN
ncbi:MAG: hypothetical protein RLZZ301_1631 [Bacteroidota bacterium]|jgi:hypothetical protein